MAQAVPRPDLTKETAAFKNLTSQQVAATNDNFAMGGQYNPPQAVGQVGASGFASQQIDSSSGLGAGMSAMGRQQPGGMNFGFSAGLGQAASAQRSKVVMMASNEVTAESSESEALMNKGKT